MSAPPAGAPAPSPVRPAGLILPVIATILAPLRQGLIRYGD